MSTHTYRRPHDYPSSFERLNVVLLEEVAATSRARTWPISKPRSGRTWEPEGDSRTWGVPVDKTRNV